MNISITSKLQDIHFVEFVYPYCCGNGPVHKNFEAPIYPGGFLRAGFEFKSRTKEPPLFDLAWQVAGAKGQFTAGKALVTYLYILVERFDPETGQGYASIDLPLLANNVGFPPLYRGKNRITVSVGLQDSLGVKDGRVHDAIHTFKPLPFKGIVPEYSVWVMEPKLDLQKRTSSEIIVFSKSIKKVDRVAQLSLDFIPSDPCGVSCPATITIPAGEAIGRGTLRFQQEPCGNRAATALLKCHIEGKTYDSLPMQFSNIIEIDENYQYKHHPEIVNKWKYCVRPTTGVSITSGSQTVTGPCEAVSSAAGLTTVCPPSMLFIIPYACAFSLFQDCHVIGTPLTFNIWTLSATGSKLCLIFVPPTPPNYDNPSVIPGLMRVCQYTPTKKTKTIVVDTC